MLVLTVKLFFVDLLLPFQLGICPSPGFEAAWNQGTPANALFWKL